MSDDIEFEGMVTGRFIIKARSREEAETRVTGYDGVTAFVNHIGVRMYLTSLRRADAEPEPIKVWVVTGRGERELPPGVFMATCTSPEAARRYVGSLTNDKVMWTREDTFVTGRYEWTTTVRTSSGTLDCKIEEDVLWS